MPDLKVTTAQRLWAFDPGAPRTYSESTGIRLRVELESHITVHRLPEDDWPVHTSRYLKGSVYPKAVNLTFEWNYEEDRWELRSGGISGVKIKNDGTPGKQEVGDSFYGEPYAWTFPVIEAALEWLTHNYALTVPTETPAWLAYAGTPIEQVPAEVRESVAAHRALHETH